MALRKSLDTDRAVGVAKKTLGVRPCLSPIECIYYCGA